MRWWCVLEDGRALRAWVTRGRSTTACGLHSRVSGHRHGTMRHLRTTGAAGAPFSLAVTTATMSSAIRGNGTAAPGSALHSRLHRSASTTVIDGGGYSSCQSVWVILTSNGSMDGLLND